MAKEKSIASQILTTKLQAPDERSFGVFKMLNEVYPAFAKKIFEGNSLMQKLVMSGMNPMDILEYPICRKCETLAPYDGFVRRGNEIVPRCTCVNEKCGVSTINPVTLREWTRQEMKKRVSEDFYEALEYAVDLVARSMIQKLQNDLQSALNVKKAQDREKIGIIMTDGSTHVVEPSRHAHHADPVEIPENAIIID